MRTVSRHGREESLRLAEAYAYEQEVYGSGDRRRQAYAQYDDSGYAYDERRGVSRRALPQEADFARPAPARRRSEAAGSARAPQPQAQQQRQGIPLMRRSAPYERRDADGRYGEAAPQAPRATADELYDYADVFEDEAPSAATSRGGQPFDAWMAREPAREYEREAAAQPAAQRGDAGAGAYDAGEDML